MKVIKKTVAVLLAALVSLTIVQLGTGLVLADTSFDDGAFRYTRTGSGALMVSKYYGEETELTLPERVGDTLVTGVYARAFEGSPLSAVIIPRGYTVIGAFAFQNCQSLERVQFPSALASVGTMAFNGCTALREADFSYTALRTLGFAAFNGCTSLANVRLPEGLSTIGENVFCNCAALSEMRLPDTLTTVSEYSFYGCGFTELSLPEGVTALGASAFAENHALEKLDLPYSLTTIGKGCFKNDPLLTEVFLADSITSLDSDSFAPMSYDGTLTVSCYRDSYAAVFGEAYGFASLNVIDKLLGDVNLDGTLNIMDATLIQQHLAELVKLSAVRLAVADANEDGWLDISDATTIQYRIAV